VRDLRDVLSAHQVAGTTLPDHLARDVLALVQAEIDIQVERRIQQMALSSELSGRKHRQRRKQDLSLAIRSLTIGGLITLLCSGPHAWVVLIAVWTALVLINGVWALQRQ